MGYKRWLTGPAVVFCLILFLGCTLNSSAATPQCDLIYDANGNLIQGSGKTLEYNDANQLIKVRYTATNELIAEYDYDHAGKRVRKIEYLAGGVTKTTYYTGSHYETTVYSNGTEINTSYYYANGERLAKKVDDGAAVNKYFIHGDHLGSTSAITNESGNLVEKTTYYPFGAIRAGGNEEKYLFTGQERDAETGLYYYGARYYDPEIRRFVQADPMILDIYNPQDLNRYSYVRNNPLKYTDPEGHVIQIPVALAVVGGAALYTADLYFTYQDIQAYREDPSVWNLAMVEFDILTTGIPGTSTAKAGVKYGFKEYGDDAIRYSDDAIKTAGKGLKLADARLKTMIYGKDLQNTKGFSTDINPKEGISYFQDHYNRHGADFGATSMEKYQTQAKTFLSGKPSGDTLELTRKNGDVVRYNPKTDEFGIVHSDGTMATYYKPDPTDHGKGTNLDYFYSQAS